VILTTFPNVWRIKNNTISTKEKYLKRKIDGKTSVFLIKITRILIYTSINKSTKKPSIIKNPILK